MIGILAIAGSRREEPRDPGALGVLDAVTVTQAATVEQLHHARPDAGRRRPRPRHVGRSHIAATVNTLVLAYLGASDDALHAGAESGSLERRVLHLRDRDEPVLAYAADEATLARPVMDGGSGADAKRR